MALRERTTATTPSVTPAGRPSRPRTRSRTRVLLVGLVVTSVLAGCAQAFPADPDDTLDRVRSTRVLNAGATVHPPQVTAPANEGDDPGGTEVDLVERYAASIGAGVEWTVASETRLVDDLEDGALDLAVAGLLEDSVWSDRAGLTRPYLEEKDEDGESLARVMGVRLGENALMSDLERFLDDAVEEQP